MQTSREGGFSGGDCVTGPATFIEAIAAGRKAAEAIDRYLGGDGDISEGLVDAEEATLAVDDIPEEKLAVFSHLPPDERSRTYDELELDVDWNVAVADGLRCLQCNVAWDRLFLLMISFSLTS